MEPSPEVNATETGDKEQGQSQNQYQTSQKGGERKRLGGGRSMLGRE